MDNDEYEPVPDQQDDEEVRDVGEEEDEEGEDLMENAERDYRSHDGLDQYEEEGIDEAEGETVDYEAEAAARRAAEDDMARRDRGQARGRLPGALYGESTDDTTVDMRPARRRRVEAAQAGDMDDDDAAGHVFINIDNLTNSRLSDTLNNESVQEEIKRLFRIMILKFVDDRGEVLYKQRLVEMARENKQSMFLYYPHLASYRPTLAIWLADGPSKMIPLLSEAAKSVLLEMFPEYDRVSKYIHVRVTDLPVVDPIRELREKHLGCLVHTVGVVTRRTGVFPQLMLVRYDCLKCGFTTPPFAQHGDHEIRPDQCPACQSKGPFQINTQETIYRNYQKLTLQESPGSVPAGRLPRHKDIILLHDLIDSARPGDEVEVTGTYTHGYDVGLNLRNGFPVFTTFIEASSVTRKEDKFAMHNLTDEDVMLVKELAKDPNIAQRVFKSIAPSIYGHTFIKKGLALGLFGGEEKRPSPAHRIRGDINVLLLGDPGTAKSQFLKYIEKTASRAVYTTGKGASAVGLTASVHKDPITKEWTLEGGALVLADKGVCLIDEFDKMNDQDRVSIHEAMEQQSISISKAGIVTQLQARCSVLAAANPIGGKYDTSRNFSENVELTDPILSRFDILCVVRDVVDPVNDQRLAEFVVDNHIFAHPEANQQGNTLDREKQDPDILSQELLRKYITYTKQNIRPQWQESHYAKIQEVYADLRARAQRAHGMPVAVRHLESMIRMAEAHAKIHHRMQIIDVDVDTAIGMMVESFISTQKFSVHRELRRQFRKYLTTTGDLFPLLMKLLQDLMREQLQERQAEGQGAFDTEFQIPCKYLEDRAHEYSITEVAPFYNSRMFTEAGFRWDSAQAAICHG